jgi:raffinose/stachyose/melibiose transport system permease protein
MSSFAISRLKFRNVALQNGLYLFLISGLMIPTYILLFPIYRMNILFKLVGTYTAVILPLAASSISFNTLMFVSYLKGFPKELEEAALIDGCGIIRLCINIVVPIIKPIIFTVTIFNILYVWNEFPLEVTLIQNPLMRTISMGVSMFRHQHGVDYGGLVAATLIILFPQIFFYIFSQKYVVEGLTAGAVKG